MVTKVDSESGSMIFIFLAAIFYTFCEQVIEKPFTLRSVFRNKPENLKNRSNT